LRNFEALEFATLEWMDWFNASRLFTFGLGVQPINFSRGSEVRAEPAATIPKEDD
jgi:hypothetical protein